jgi:glucose/arabinose dehydrogenase
VIVLHHLRQRVITAGVAALIGCGLVLVAAPSAVAAPVLPAGFVSEKVIPQDLPLATAISFAPDGRIFVALKSGVVRVIQDGQLLPTPFVDISDRVNNYIDRGMLGIAVHPAFPEMPYVYLLYAHDPPGVAADGQGARVAQLMRVTANPDDTNVAAAPTSETRKVILGTNSTFANVGAHNTYDGDVNNPACGRPGARVQDCIPSDGTSHTIGTVIFDRDGKLLVGAGDGASFNFADYRALRAQDTQSLAGKILKIDPITGAGVPGNMFYDPANPNSNRSKVHNLGLRNPFRFTQDATSGTLWVGEVGWSSWEEIDTGRGKNFGWPCYEGVNRQTGYETAASTKATCATFYSYGQAAWTRPHHYYSHPPGASVNAGPIYRGTNFPSAYGGSLFFADFNRDTMWRLFGAPVQAPVIGTDVADNGAAYGGPVQIILGPDGTLYYVTIRGDGSSQIRRIRYTAAGNRPPVAKIVADPTDGDVPLTVRFAGGGSTDPDGNPLTYRWAFGDGGTSTEPTVDHTYTTRGVFTASLTVTDPSGATSTVTQRITAGTGVGPTLTINNPPAGTLYTDGQTIGYSGTATDPQDGDISGQIHWSISQGHNEHTHPDLHSSTGPSGSFGVPAHADNSWLNICATVTDSDGQDVQACREIRPRTAPVTVTSSPAGIQWQYDEQQKPTPINANSIINSRRTLSAPAGAANGGWWYVFQRWSDSGAISHDVTITGPATYTATYARQTQPLACNGANGVYLYANANYTGACVRFVLNAPTMVGTAVGDNQASSIRIVGAYRADMYRDPNLAGITSWTAASVANLAGWRIGDNQISSVKITPQ